METGRRWAMFESLVEVRREGTFTRKAWTLPLALAFHGTGLTLILLYSLFAREVLIPPSSVFLSSPVDIIPVQLGGFAGGEKSEETVPEPDRKPEPPDSTRLVAPDPDRDLDEESLIQVDRYDSSSSSSGPWDQGPTGPGIQNGVPGGVDPTDRSNSTAVPGKPPRVLVPNEGGLVSALRVVRQTQPSYPNALSSMGVAGRVELEIVVDENGRVESVTVIGSTNPLFTAAAVSAVKTWLYQPPVSKAGSRVAVTKHVVVNFSPR
jgi:protein TonB